jgi:3',5'-cyclic AMP phosphodiesterase CpdA
MFTLAHLSDLHATPLARARLRDLALKQRLGWLSWHARRRRHHRPEVLEGLLEDLRGEAPDHVAVTGDLTNVGHVSEFPAARLWLERLGDAGFVSLVPGNHDAYVPLAFAAGWAHWREYLAPDSDAEAAGASPGAGGSPVGFPTLRVRGPLALVGVNTALPTGPLLATGRVGADQLARLERLLEKLAATGLWRVVLMHHPPCEGAVPRRALTDAAPVREVLARAGAELVLHGHAHRTLIREIPGPRGPIPVVGARSGSDAGSRPGKRAQYHLYRLEPGADGPRIELSIREWDPQTRRFRGRCSTGLARLGVLSPRARAGS